MLLDSAQTSNAAIKNMLTGVQQQTLPLTPKQNAIPAPPAPPVAPSAPKIEAVPGAKPINMAPKHTLVRKATWSKDMPQPHRVTGRSVKLGSYKYLASVLAHLDVKPDTSKQAAASALLQMLGQK